MASHKDVINAVKTPLGFFTLVVLVVEVIFGILAKLSSGNLQFILGLAMVLLIFLLVFIVAYLAVKHPESLKGERTAIAALSDDVIKKGSKVVILNPARKTILEPNGAIEWDKRMEPFIGKKATVTLVSNELPIYSLNIDNGAFKWHRDWLVKFA
jgi:hypothetical protein